ncbi:MAG: transposase [Syntrophomonas sp.]|nr:transposase [Syntrophomonas sp.]
MARLQREYSTTGFYHIMLRGNERKKIFWDDEDRQRFIEILQKKESEKELLIYAYCLMDNHVHLVLRDDKNEISIIMKGIATSYAMFFNNRYCRVGHVFQDRFKSEAIEDERYLMAAIRYIHNNPIKAGLVETPEQYKWSSYHCYIVPNQTEETIVDAAYILGMISDNQKRAIIEFQRFSMETNDYDFMDEDEGVVRTLKEGESYLEQYMKKNWPGVNQDEIRKNKSIMKKVIADLRTNTKLPIVKIANLLGVNRGVVERITTKP